ncbi:MAG: gamma-butyrobetaine hydroxylase-like domain-containing protein, partial [Candidatus Poseidoniales archaeon]
MEERNQLTEIERGDESCILRFKDGASYEVEYLAIRSRCQCAKCKPRQENEQRI